MVRRLLASLLLLAGLVLCLPASAQQYVPIADAYEHCAKATNYGGMKQNSNVITHILTWTSNAGTGAISSCTLQLQSASDGVSYSNLGAAQAVLRAARLR